MNEIQQTGNIKTMVAEENTAAYVAKFKKKRKWMFISLAIMIGSMIAIFPLGAIFGSPLPGIVSGLIFLTMGVSMVAMFVFMAQAKSMQLRIKK